MYFSPKVKEKREDFFNYEIMQEELKKAIEDRLVPLIAIYGLRRTGKTSLIRVVLNSLKKRYLWIDGRDVQSREELKTKLAEEAQKLRRFSLKKISVKGIEFSLGAPKEGLDYLNKHKVILVFDEAQLLKNIHLDSTLAYIYDNFPNIKIILSGSEVGMLANFLGKENVNAPLFGRAVYELHTHRLDKEKASLFLQLGAKQLKISIKDKEISDAILNLDGIIGWLTKYGWFRRDYPHKEALRKTLAEGKYIARDEFLKFSLRAGKKYVSIIGAIKGGAYWEEIKKKTRISDKQLAAMLKRLINYGFVEKHDKLYRIADPLLEAAY